MDQEKSVDEQLKILRGRYIQMELIANSFYGLKPNLQIDNNIKVVEKAQEIKKEYMRLLKLKKQQ